MLDFRYHALSLVAVFLALAIGILLGVTLGDSLVSEADRGVRSSLREDVVRARQQASRAQAGVRSRDRLSEAAFPRLARDRLRGRRVTLVSSGALPEAVEASVREAVEVAGGEVGSVAILDLGDGLRELAEAAGSVDLVVGEEGLWRRFGGRLGRSLARGTGLVERLQERVPERFRGDFGGAEAVVVFRAPDRRRERGRPPPSPEEESVAEGRRAVEDAMVEAMRRDEVRIVGVEGSRTEPSQVPFFAERELSSVDSVDLPGGRAALVFALSGAEGTFGFKPTAEAPLPEIADEARPRRGTAGP